MNSNSSQSIILKEESYDLSQLTQMTIETDSADVTIKQTDEQQIKVIIYGQDKVFVESEIKDNILNIEKKSNHYFGLSYDRNEIVLYVPKAIDIPIQSKTSSGDTNIADFDNVSIHAIANSGDIIVGKMKKLNVKTDSGDVIIASSNNSNVKTSSGEVHLSHINDIYVDAKSHSGDIDIKDNNRFSKICLKIETRSGDIIVE